MIHKPYVMKAAEVSTLVTSLISNGPEETYARMRAKAFMDMDKINNIDEIFLDMSEAFLGKARNEPPDKKEDGDKLALSNVYYIIAFMIRRLAHEIHRRYIKKGKQRDSDRFIRLVSYNKKAPLLTI